MPTTTGKSVLDSSPPSTLTRFYNGWGLPVSQIIGNGFLVYQIVHLRITNYNRQ